MRTILFALIGASWLLGAFYYSATVEINNGNLIYETYSTWGNHLDEQHVIPIDIITDFKVVARYVNSGGGRGASGGPSYYVRVLTPGQELDMKYIRSDNKRAIRFCKELKDACNSGVEFRRFSVKHKSMFWLSGMFIIISILSFISDYFHLGDVKPKERVGGHP